MKTCTREITYKGTFFSIDDVNFSINEMKKTMMTSPRKKSDSIYQIHYFISLELQDTKKIKFWIESKASFEDYFMLCEFFTSAIMLCPEKLNFK
ncbi:hypothetical protein [Anaerorhabdus furcosa]|uniref:hypothetical protein n=1 Tax=Anaerorhabdus furcosa TaxID=118967 RepID=UPI00099A15A4|nr:hypothetical protein [Anaerorhabdus furcosa]